MPILQAAQYLPETAEANLAMAQHDFKLPPTLSDEEIAVILDKLDDLISWAGDVKEYALNAALHGTRFHGWKLVEGRSNRRYTDETAVAQIVSGTGHDPYEHQAARHHRYGKAARKEAVCHIALRSGGAPAR